MSRRGFLGVAAAGLAGVMLAPGIRLIEIAQAASSAATPTAGASPKVRWGMLIDTTKCASGCTDCVTACNTENGLDPRPTPTSAQCWHITGTELVRPVLISLISTLRIHCASVARGRAPATGEPNPFSVLQALTQSLQPLAHLVVSINMPQRTAALAPVVGAVAAGAACAISIRRMPGASSTPPAAAAATPRKARRVIWCPRPDAPAPARAASAYGNRSSRSSPPRSCGS